MTSHNKIAHNHITHTCIIDYHVHVAHFGGGYATQFTQYTHQNTCVSEDESMKGIRSSIPAWIIVPN